MNAFIKNCLRIAGISILLGLVLGAIGFSMDNTVFDNWEDFNVTIGNNNYHSDKGLITKDSGEWDNDSWDRNGESDSSSDVEQKDDLDSDDLDLENVDSDNSENYEDIKSLSMDISYGTVNIKEGDSFDIEVENLQKDEIQNTIEDGVWIISDNNDDSGYTNEISIFGIKITNSSINNPFHPGTIELTVPKDFDFENLEISLGAGTIKADKLTSENANIDVGAGSLRIKELSAVKESSYSIDTGNLVIDYLTAHNANINCGVGNLTASGNITGDSYITCGIGNVDLNITGKEDDYNYSIDCGIGTVIINGNSYSGVNSRTKRNNNAENSFTLDCGIGKIALKIQ